MPRGSKPGERRGGRQKGVPNKAGRELREVAKEYTPVAMKTLAEICEKGESEAARVAAANALLDRGHGKPTSVVVADVTQRPGQTVHSEPVSETVKWIESVLNDPKSKRANGIHDGE
jgi:hypothetical protein